MDTFHPFWTLFPKHSFQTFSTLNLTAKTKTEIFGAINYVSSCKCVLMSAIWYKVLKAIDERIEQLRLVMQQLIFK